MAPQAMTTRSAGQHRRVYSESRMPAESWISNIVYFIFGVIEVLLALRFALELFGANASAGFVQLVYNLSAPFMAPFAAVFGATRVENSVFDWSILLAIAIYALLAWGIASLIHAISPRRDAGTVESVEEVDEDTTRRGM